MKWFLSLKEFDFNHVMDLKGKIVGACNGCRFGLEFEKAKKIFELSIDNNNSQRLRKLVFDRIDAALFSPGAASLNYEIRSINGIGHDNYLRSQFSIIEKPVFQDSNHLAFSKELNMKVFIGRFNKVIRKGYESGDIQSIIDKY